MGSQKSQHISHLRMSGDSVPGYFLWNYKLGPWRILQQKRNLCFFEAAGTKINLLRTFHTSWESQGPGLWRLSSMHIILGTSSNTLAPSILVISPSLFIFQAPKKKKTFQLFWIKQLSCCSCKTSIDLNCLNYKRRLFTDLFYSFIYVCD